MCKPYVGYVVSRSLDLLGNRTMGVTTEALHVLSCIIQAAILRLLLLSVGVDAVGIWNVVTQGLS